MIMSSDHRNRLTHSGLDEIYYKIKETHSMSLILFFWFDFWSTVILDFWFKNVIIWYIDIRFYFNIV